MAFQQANFISPQKQQEEKKPKKSALETIMEGLQIAGGVLGAVNSVENIKTGMAQRENSALQRRATEMDIAAKTKASEDASAGVLTKEQELAARKDFDPAAEGEAGSFILGQIRGQDGKLSPLVGKAKTPLQKAAQGRYVEAPGPDGKPVHRWAPDGGPDVPAYQKPMDPTAALDKRDDKLKSARERAQFKLNNDLQQLDTQIASADEVLQIAELAKTNPAAAGAIGLKLARAAGEKGVLSDADKKDYGGSQALMDRLNRYVQRSSEGTLTQEDAAFAAAFAETMRGASERARTQLIERNIQQFTRNYGGDFAENYAVISGRDYEPPQTKPQAPAPTPKPESGTAFAAPSADSAPVRQKSPKDGKWYVKVGPDQWVLDKNQSDDEMTQAVPPTRLGE